MSNNIRFHREEGTLLDAEHFEELYVSDEGNAYRNVNEKVNDMSWRLLDDLGLYNFSLEEELYIARAGEVSSHNLDVLAEHTFHESVRTAIASNINADSLTLQHLAQIAGSFETIAAVIENDSTSVTTLLYITFDAVPIELKEQIANHYRFPDVVAELLAMDVKFDWFPAAWREAILAGRQNL